MISESKGLRGAQKTETNLTRFEEYIQKLIDTGQTLPPNQFGTVSVEAVAEKVGCTVKVLLKGSLKDKFERAKEEIGVATKKNLDSKLAKKADEKTKENSSLMRRLNQKITECEKLNEENQHLRDKIRRQELRDKEGELSLHELLRTGRRFTL